MAQIDVSGRAALKLPAERVNVSVRVSREGPTAAGLMDSVVETHGRLRADAEAFVEGGAATRFTVERAGLRRRSQWNPALERHEDVFGASAALGVRFADFDAASVWVTRIADDGAAEITEIEWSLTGDTTQSALEQLRTEAVQDAVRRARTYAAAAGVDQLELATLREGADELESFGVRPISGAGSAGAEPYIVLVPEWIELEQAVSASFATKSGGL